MGAAVSEPEEPEPAHLVRFVGGGTTYKERSVSLNPQQTQITQLALIFTALLLWLPETGTVDSHGTKWKG